MSGASSIDSCQNAFAAAANGPLKATKRRPAPVSIRFTEEERTKLAEWAQGRPIGTVVRERLFGRNTKKGRKVSPPPRQQKALANALRRLGHSGVAAYLTGQITALEEGRLMLSQQEERDLRNADRECYDIRRDLMIALGIDAEGPPS